MEMNSIINSEGNEALSARVKLSIILVLVFLLKTNFLFSEFLHNLGLPYLRFQKVIFFFLPGIFIYLRGRVNGNIRFRNLAVLGFFLLIQLFLDGYVHGDTFGEEGLDQIRRWMYIYSGYFILSNVGLKYLDFIVKSVISLIAFNAALIYGDYLGLINVANISADINGDTGRLSSSINMNAFSDINILAVYAVYWLNINQTPYTLNKVRISNYILVIFFVALTFLQSARGSLLLLFIGILLYFYGRWKGLTFQKRMLVITALMIMILLQSSILNLLTENFAIFERVSSTTLNSDVAEDNQDGRTLQVFATMTNFLSSPIVGVGSANAAIGSYEGITRSNFQYGHILASGGLMLFLAYIAMIYNLFGYSLKLLRSDLIARSCLLFVLFALIFRRPDSYMAIIATIASYRYAYMKTNSLL